MENNYNSVPEKNADDFLNVVPIKEDWGGDGRGRMNLSGRCTAISKEYIPRQYQFFDANSVPEENEWRISGMPENNEEGRRKEEVLICRLGLQLKMDKLNQSWY